MAWIYFRELVGLASLSDHGSELSPIVKLNDTLRACFCPACNEVSLAKLPYGTMCELSNAKCSQELTSSPEDFHAKTSVLQDMEQAWRETEVDFSSKLSGSQKKLERLLCSSKMFPQLELEDFGTCSEHLPIFGMTVDGLVFLPQKLEPVIAEKDGSYLPTIGANEFKGAGRSRYIGSKEYRGAKMSEGLRHQFQDPIYTHPSFAEVAMGYPLGWTALEDWATQWFRPKREKLLKDCVASND